MKNVTASARPPDELRVARKRTDQEACRPEREEEGHPPFASHGQLEPAPSLALRGGQGGSPITRATSESLKPS